MSERIVSDPSQHGWTEVDGKWMWGGSGGGSGSIQDGDTEGQITTWDGTEWTPEGAVVVSDGNVITGKNLVIQDKAGGVGALGELTFVNSDVITGQSGKSAIQSERVSDPSGGFDGSTLSFMTTNGGDTAELDTRMSIDGDGNVNIIGKLFINGEEVTAGGGGGGLWTDNGDGTISYSGVAKASDFIAE